ncbi:alpha/beta hydrolase [Priestia koreensis]|uniref:alpha/beta hydrolase n=1 Tax=Priestia koreensis TaxID=284581 RepID=UPI001F5A7E85|nr:alpha/beta hydrolase [Priestia koreensis]UNL84836.1 alpha/beta hydrolase [Priestia koreensis]
MHLKKYLLVLSILLITFSTVFIDFKPVKAASGPVPTLFVHGYGGSADTFNRMIKRFEYNGWGTKTLTCTVSKKGTASCKGSLSTKTKHPLVQVIFEDPTASLQDTTFWFTRVLKLLKEKYKVTSFNIISHSMGGIVSTKYIEDTSKNDWYPKVNRIVTLGSPFGGVSLIGIYKKLGGPASRDLLIGSKALSKIQANGKYFYKNTKMLSVAGRLNPNEMGDGLVEWKSAIASKKIVPKKNFEEYHFIDFQASHSGLHESKTVDKKVGNYLWGYTR